MKRERFFALPHASAVPKEVLAEIHMAPGKGAVIPRSHHNCNLLTGRSRPGKTAADKHNGSWASKHTRRARHIARDPNHGGK